MACAMRCLACVAWQRSVASNLALATAVTCSSLALVVLLLLLESVDDWLEISWSQRRDAVVLVLAIVVVVETIMLVAKVRERCAKQSLGGELLSDGCRRGRCGSGSSGGRCGGGVGGLGRGLGDGGAERKGHVGVRRGARRTRDVASWLLLRR